jgi:hypothetical protein
MGNGSDRGSWRLLSAFPRLTLTVSRMGAFEYFWCLNQASNLQVGFRVFFAIYLCRWIAVGFCADFSVAVGLLPSFQLVAVGRGGQKRLCRWICAESAFLPVSD